MIVALAIILAVSFAYVADASHGRPLEVKYPDIPGADPLTSHTSLPALLNYFFRFFVVIGGLIAFGSIVSAGFLFMTSGANPGLRAKAMARIRQTMLGLVLLLGTYVLLNTINPELVYLRSPGTQLQIGDYKGVGAFEAKLREAQEKSFARKCIGPDTFTEHIKTSHQDIAEIICKDRNVAPTDAMIHETLTGMVNKVECNEQDVRTIADIIKQNDSLCGTGGAPSKEVVIIEPGTGEKKVVVIKETTIPKDDTLCTFSGTGKGIVYGTVGGPPNRIGEVTSLYLRNKETDLLRIWEENLRYAINSCEKNPNAAWCTFKDGTKLASFKEQNNAITALVQYCYEITGKEHTTF